MVGPKWTRTGLEQIIEGKTGLYVTPSGGLKGPASKGGVFFNPAMVQNRDLSVVLIQKLIDHDLLPGKNKRVLDGLCGSGARTVRVAVETDLLSNDIEIIGTDINPASIDTANMNAASNEVPVKFINKDLNGHLVRERFSYIDIDPFGSPVPFVRSAILGVLNGGYIGVTATDTAALTGSIPRVARRRYGVEAFMTHAYQEIACRSLMGYIARTAATFERGVEPVLFYTSDHFIRGYVRVNKGAKKADTSLKNVGWLQMSRPGPPEEVYSDIGEMQEIKGKITGPIWTGPLADPDLCSSLQVSLDVEKTWEYLSSYKQLKIMMERCLTETDLPMLGYDVNILSSHLKVSPPSMVSIFEKLQDLDREVSRSRFSPTIFKTDASWEEVSILFLKEDR